MLNIIVTYPIDYLDQAPQGVSMRNDENILSILDIILNLILPKRSGTLLAVKERFGKWDILLRNIRIPRVITRIVGIGDFDWRRPCIERVPPCLDNIRAELLGSFFLG